MTAAAQHHMSEGSQFSQDLEKREVTGAHLVELKSMQVKSPSPIDDTSSNFSDKMVVVGGESTSSPTSKHKTKTPKRHEETKLSHSGGTPTSPGKSPKAHRKHDVQSPTSTKKPKRREDRRGVHIKKGSRRHHISFVDEKATKSITDQKRSLTMAAVVPSSEEQNENLYNQKQTMLLQKKVTYEEKELDNLAIHVSVDEIPRPESRVQPSMEISVTDVKVNDLSRNEPLSREDSFFKSMEKASARLGNKSVSVHMGSHFGDRGVELQVADPDDEDEKQNEPRKGEKKYFQIPAHKRKTESNIKRGQNLLSVSITNLDLAMKEKPLQAIEQQAPPPPLQQEPENNKQLDQLPRRVESKKKESMPIEIQPKPQLNRKKWHLIVQSLEQVPSTLLCPFCFEIFNFEKQPFRPFYSLLKAQDMTDKAICRQCLISLYNQQKYKDFIRISLNDYRSGCAKEMVLNFKNNLARSVKKFMLLYFEADMQRLSNSLKFLRYINVEEENEKENEASPATRRQTLKPNQLTLGGTDFIIHSPRDSISTFAHMCPVCNYCFDDSSHLPYSLECGHKVCKNCLLTSPYVLTHNDQKYEVTCPKDHQIFEYDAGEKDVTEYLEIDGETLRIIVTLQRNRKFSQQSVKKHCDFCKRVFCELNRPFRIFTNCHLICYYCLFKNAVINWDDKTVKLRCPVKKCGNAKSYLYEIRKNYQNFQTFLHSVTNDVWQDDKLFDVLKKNFLEEMKEAEKEVQALEYPKPTLLEREMGQLNLNCPGCDQDYSQDRLPYHLDCPHNLCQTCILEQLSTPQNDLKFLTVQCPVCKIEMIKENLYGQEIFNQLNLNPEFVMSSMNFITNTKHLQRINKYRQKAGILGDMKRDLECCLCYELINHENPPRKPHTECGYMICTNCVAQMYPQGFPINCFCAGVDNAEGLNDVLSGDLSQDEKLRLILEKVPIHEEKQGLLEKYEKALQEAMAWN